MTIMVQALPSSVAFLPLALMSGRLAMQGLGHAVDSAAGLGYLTHVYGGNLEAARAQLFDQRLARCRRDHPVAAERHEVAAERHRILERHVDDVVPLALQPIDDARFGA